MEYHSRAERTAVETSPPSPRPPRLPLAPFHGVLQDGELLPLDPIDAIHRTQLDGHLHRLLVVAPLPRAPRSTRGVRGLYTCIYMTR